MTFHDGRYMQCKLDHDEWYTKPMVCCLHGCAWLCDSELAKVAGKKAVLGVAGPNHTGLYLEISIGW